MDDTFHIQWHITNLCNLRCKHCYQNDFSNVLELDIKGLRTVSENIINTLEKWGKRACINLTGGEPLLKPELFDLLRILEQSIWIYELGIITNGIFLDERIVKGFSEFSRFKKLKVSLDGASAEVNDSIRKGKTFSRVIKNLSSIKGERDFEIILMFTVMKRNIQELPSFFELSKVLGVNGVIIERFIPLGKGAEIRDEVLSKEDWRRLIKMLSEIFSIDEEESFLSFQAFQVSFNKEEPMLFGAPCVIGKDGLCIMPNGDVFPCRRLPISIGNLLDKQLKEIWDGSELLKALTDRKNIKGKCKSCNIDNCFGCRSLALSLSGDPFSEDPHCWYEF